MRKIFLLVVIVSALAIPATAIAVAWDDRQNQDLVAKGADCPQGGTGNEAGGAWYHFVLNQVSGDYLAGVQLTATFDVSGVEGPIDPTAVNKKMQHFDIFGIGELQSAETVGVDPGGRAGLVISGVVCGKKGTPDRA